VDKYLDKYAKMFSDAVKGTEHENLDVKMPIPVLEFCRDFGNQGK